MKNSIHTQLGYKSIEEFRQEYNGIFELKLSNELELYDVINIFIRKKITFSIDHDINNSNMVILKF